MADVSKVIGLMSGTSLDGVDAALLETYGETIARLPHSYQANDNRRAISDRAFTRAELGLPEQGIVFCCFNNSFKIGPEEFGLDAGRIEHLRGGDAEANAEIVSGVLSGERKDEARSLVIMNAAAALFLGGAAGSLREGARLAAHAIDSGAARRKLELLIEATSGP